MEDFGEVLKGDNRQEQIVRQARPYRIHQAAELLTEMLTHLG